MKKLALIFLISVIATVTSAKQTDNYKSLDTKNPIVFGGDNITYNGQKIMLGETAFFVDGQLSNEIASKYPFVFNSITEAVKHLKNGTEQNPMTLYLAPYVYWVDNPDDPEVRKGPNGRAPFGMTIKCDWLKFQGLTSDPKNVVLASNRGQTLGSIGNFTMFYIDGMGVFADNVTFGNYCSIDLEFPLKPELNRVKRSPTIVQAQLIICNSDKVFARNTRFVSRLNLCPFAGAKRALFEKCHFESTDDALCGTGVYLDCDLTFYGSKPFYSTQGTGAVFFNCDFDSRTKNEQFLTKAGSQVAIVDSRFKSENDSLFLGWTSAPTDNLRSYQYNVSLNGRPVLMDADKPWLTVDMTDKEILKAYRIERDGKVIYNTYNLLRGNDDWDPMGVKNLVEDNNNIPTYIKVSPVSANIESGVTTAKLTVEQRRFGNITEPNANLTWSVAPENNAFVKLNTLPDGSCEVIGTNNEDQTKTIMVIASTASGLESASVITVAPEFIDAPEFTKLPTISIENGKLNVDYTIDLGKRADESLITWYRCKDSKGTGAIEVAVSRLNKPETNYELTEGDAGYYIMATVEPKHLRCNAGEPQKAITAKPIAKTDIVKKDFYTDFQNFSTKYQPEIIPGFWTVDCYKPLDTADFDWKTTTKDSWEYGLGVDGSVGTGLLQAQKGARLLYTPLDGKYGDMTITMNVDPCKQAGQGFGSATGQYMDIYIKFDTRTLTGYALRIIRTTKYDHAVDFVLMKYENGVTSEISEPIASTCYRAGCYIILSIKGDKFTAHAENKKNPVISENSKVKAEVSLEATITPNTFAGSGIQHTGSVGASATMLHDMTITK